MSGRIRWHLHDDAAAATDTACRALATLAAQALGDSGRFSIVLAGGATPRALYRAAAKLDTDWRRWDFFFGDERCLPRGDAQRNDRLALEAWLDSLPIRSAQVHAIPAELGPDVGAARYAETLAGVGTFDVVILGCGADGHTASLFPGQPLGAEAGAPDALAVHEAPKPPAERVTMSAARLARARATLLLAFGREKRDALEALRDGADVPLRATIGESGLDVFTDRAACGSPDPVRA